MPIQTLDLHRVNLFAALRYQRLKSCPPNFLNAEENVKFKVTCEKQSQNFHCLKFSDFHG